MSVIRRSQTLSIAGPTSLSVACVSDSVCVCVCVWVCTGVPKCDCQRRFQAQSARITTWRRNSSDKLTRSKFQQENDSFSSMQQQSFDSVIVVYISTAQCSRFWITLKRKSHKNLDEFLDLTCAFAFPARHFGYTITLIIPSIRDLILTSNIFFCARQKFWLICISYRKWAEKILAKISLV